MTTNLPAEIRAIDETLSELDRLMKQVLALADMTSVDRAEIERLEKQASAARLEGTGFMLEAGAVFIKQARGAHRQAVLQ